MSEQKRCQWATNSIELYQVYHDEEWGVPVYDDHLLFEMLVLESFQAGLSWLIILKKREAFRQAFDNFDITKIVAYQDDKIQALLNDQKIVRSIAKIKATISNAQAFMSVQAEYGKFANYIWSFTERKIIDMVGSPFVTTNDLSDRIAKDLKQKGFKFMGSTTVFAYLQAIGIINAHDADCFCVATGD